MDSPSALRSIQRSYMACCLGVMLAACSPRGAPAPAHPAAPAKGALGKLVDLSHPFDEHTLYWPTSPTRFELTSLHHGTTSGGYFYASNTLCTPEHGGTHLDAPIHFAERGATAEAIPLERLVAPAVVIDFTARASRDRDALLGTADITAFEAAHGAIERGSIVLIRSGWSQRWPNAREYLGDDTAGDASRLHFPGLAREGAEALVARGVGAVGIDTASIDHGPSTDFQAHRTLMAADIPAFENLTGLDALPVRGAIVVALPMKIARGSGGPLRAIALLP